MILYSSKKKHKQYFVALTSLKAFEKFGRPGESDQAPDLTSRSIIWNENDASECLEFNFRVTKSTDSEGLYILQNVKKLKLISRIQ